MATSTVELHSLHLDAPRSIERQQEILANSNEPQDTTNGFPSLPPVDSGKQAWLFLAACWGVEAVTFGFGFSFGVFQDYYSSHAPFAGSGSIAAIGTTTTGILYLGAPFIVMVCKMYPQQARWFTLAGLFIASIGLAMSSFCTSVPQLIITQGVVFGFGGCISYCPCTLYIDEWFVRRKGLAYGIVWSAAGFGGAVLPLVLEALLQKVGFAKTAQICAGILCAISAPLSFWVKPRLPHSASVQRQPLKQGFATSRLFVLYQLANIIEATGYFLPTIYLPTYARTTLGASHFLAALTIILVNISATVSLVLMGHISDRLHVTTCMFISAAGVATSVLAIWGLASNLATLYVFCVFYGLFAGCWPAIWPGIMKELAKKEGDGRGGVTNPMVLTHLCFGKGIGNVISGPLSDALIKGKPWQDKAMGGYGSGFGAVIVYTGMTGLLSGTNLLLKHWKLL
ncbi:MFS general substrate transporter [Bimuria novae-zelandiae CBS 107.79]|uniref:MFS general substrate transporter n=1 Tax=Bimuria novae-zelandiae CBS 107.79 TaxID=1447943 RepID=A0A6A5UQV9_9PLEO|nr:MFS general substrate transporter [Bimuria novae-zelandiae CBS 107.79]